MYFNRNDFLDWAEAAQNNPIISDYQDEINSNKNLHTDSNVAAINHIISQAMNPTPQNFNIDLKKNELNEAFPRFVTRDKTHHTTQNPLNTERKFQSKVFGDKEYLKPSPGQLKTALAKQAELKEPLNIKGQGSNQVVTTGQDVRDRARDKRIAKIAKRTTPMGKGRLKKAGSIVGRILKSANLFTR